MNKFDDIEEQEQKVIHTQCHDCQVEPYNETTKKYDLYRVWAPDKEVVLVCDDCRYIRRGKKKFGEAQWLLRWQTLQARIIHAKPMDVFTHSKASSYTAFDHYADYVGKLPRTYQEFVDMGMMEKMKEVMRR